MFSVSSVNRSAVQQPSPAVRTAMPREPKKANTRPLRDSTAAAYAKDVRLFVEGGGKVPCDVDGLLSYVHKMRHKLAPTTLHRRLMAVRGAHIAGGLPSPTEDPRVRLLLRSLQLGVVPSTQPGAAGANTPKRREAKASLPITRRLLEQMLDYVHRSMRDRRDRALLTLGFVAALKRAELVALDVGDVEFTPDAMLISVRSGRAVDATVARSTVRKVAVPITGGSLCAGTAVRSWIEQAALDAQTNGPLFCSFDRGGDPTSARLDAAWVSVVVKQRLTAAGIDAARYSAESLPRGRRLEAAKGTL